MDNSTEFLLPNQETMPTLDQLMRLMAEHNGSDLFASAGAYIKIKIEGSLVSLCPIPLKPDDIYLILAEGLDSNQLGTLDETKELNCAIPVPGVGRFRVSAMVQRNSKAFVIRYIPHTIPPFESLNLPSTLIDLIMRKRGLMLVVGPTGSGKSTTLASLVDYRNKTRDDHILTIEDPIEFLFKHQRSIVNQREVGTDSLSYHESLRNALRQAPDVILIGEIRDQETMNMAMQYAQSGHLCIATMHANNSYHALNRIVGFYSPDYRQALYQDLASSLNAIVAQRLIPTLDGKRAAAVEILENTIRIRELIEKGAINDIPEAMERSLNTGTQTFLSQLIGMVKNKVISPDNAMIFSDSPSQLHWALSNLDIKLDLRVSAAKEAGLDRDKIIQGADGNEPGDSAKISLANTRQDIFTEVILNTDL